MTENRKERRKIIGAILASLAVHCIVAFSLAAFGSATAPLPDLADKPVELTLMDMPMPTPPLLLPKKPGYIDTSQESREAPKEKTFESHANSIGASETEASGDDPLPSQDGKDRPFLELENSNMSLPMEGSAPKPPPQPEATPLEQPTPRPTPKATPLPTPVETPKPTQTPTPPPPTPTPEPEKFAMLTATPPPPIEPQTEDPPDPTTQMMTPVPSVRPQPEMPASEYQRYREKTRLSGNISNRGVSAVNAIGTPLGVYQKALYNAIGSRWYYYTNQQRDLIGIGTARVAFSIDRNGRVANLKVLENSANEAFANVCLQSIIEVKLPPIPEDVAAALPPGGLDQEVTFTSFAN